MKAFLALVACLIIYTTPSNAQDIIELSCPHDYLTEMSARVLTEAYHRIGITLKLRIVPAERSLYQSNSGDTDGEVGRIQGIEQTYTNLIKVPTPVSYFEVMAFTKNLKFQVNGWESLKPYRIVARRGIKYAEKNTENMNREFTDSYKQAFKLVDLGRADICISSKINGILNIKNLNLKNINALEPPIQKFNLYHYIHKKNIRILPKIDSSLRGMHEDGLIEKIRKDYIEEINSSFKK